MTKEEFQKVKVGDTLIEGSNHFIIVDSIWGNDRIVYKEDGYSHEVNYEYLSFPGLFESLKHHFENTSQEVLNKEREELESLNEIGPDVLEYADYYNELLTIKE
jgi:hypothetical protein